MINPGQEVNSSDTIRIDLIKSMAKELTKEELKALREFTLNNSGEKQKNSNNQDENENKENKPNSKNTSGQSTNSKKSNKSEKKVFGQENEILSKSIKSGFQDKAEIKSIDKDLEKLDIKKHINWNDKVEPLNKQVYKPKTKNFCSQEEEIFGCDNREDTSNKLRMLLRFNCGRCQRKYSKIFIPTAFSKCCEKCNNPTDLVVLRSDKTNLYGGYLCKNCENRFLTVLPMTSFKSFTPLCNNCNMYCKMYQALLNKSKISIRNIKVYVCNICQLEHTKSFYQPYGNFDSSVPVCCDNKCSYIEIRREFTFHKLNEEGRSENFAEGTTKMHLNKYNNQNFYGKNRHFEKYDK